MKRRAGQSSSPSGRHLRPVSSGAWQTARSLLTEHSGSHPQRGRHAPTLYDHSTRLVTMQPPPSPAAKHFASRQRSGPTDTQELAQFGTARDAQLGGNSSRVEGGARTGAAPRREMGVSWSPGLHAQHGLTWCRSRRTAARAPSR